MVEYLKQWKVQGGAKDPYTISVTKDGTWTCSCVGWTRHMPRQDCKHIKKIKADNQTRLIQFGDSVQALINAVDRAEGLSARQLVEQKGMTKADAARVKREEVAAKKQKALGKIRYGFQLAEAYRPEDMISGKWIAEPKLDGELAMAIDSEFVLRSGTIATHQFPEISKVADAVLVGELCVFDETTGLTVFSRIQQRRVEDPLKISLGARTNPAKFVVFDMLEYQGQSMVDEPFEQRRKTLEGYFKVYGKNLKNVQLVEQISISTNEDVLTLVNKARELGMEGIMVKNLAAPWQARRGRNMTKAKTWNSKEVTIVKFEWTGVGGGFVVYVDNGAAEPLRVNMGDHKMREKVIAGHKRVEIKYLTEDRETHVLRFPTVLRLV